MKENGLKGGKLDYRPASVRRTALQTWMIRVWSGVLESGVREAVRRTPPPGFVLEGSGGGVAVQVGERLFIA